MHYCMLLCQRWRHITQGAVTWARMPCHPLRSGGAGKRSRGDMYYQSIPRYLLTADKNLGTLLSESGTDFSIVGTVKQKTFISPFMLHLSTFLHLTILHHFHSLGSCWSHPGSHLHVRLVSIASWLSLRWFAKE